MTEAKKKLDGERLQKEFGLTKDEISSLALLAIVPMVTPTIFVEADINFSKVSQQDFGTKMTALMDKKYIVDSASFPNQFLKRELRDSIVDCSADEIFFKQVEQAILAFSSIKSDKTIAEKAMEGYCKALLSILLSSREQPFANFSNSSLIRRLDATILQQTDLEHSTYSEFIDKDSWKFLQGVLSHPYLSLEE